MDRSSSRPLRCRCQLSCIADNQRRRPVARLAAIVQCRQTKARLCFPLRDLAQPEYNLGGGSHRTAWAESRRPRPEVLGYEYHRSDRQLSVRWESHCPIETNSCANRGHSCWACRSRQPSSRCGSVRVTARTPLRTKMPWRSTLPNALKLRLHFQPRCRHRLWQLLVWYLALGTTGNREQRLEKRMSSAKLLSKLSATATCFDYTIV
jgi:hypothetical protein